MSSTDPAAPPTEPIPQAPNPAPVPPRRRWPAWLAGSLAAVVLLLGLAAGALWWALDRPAGTAWVLARVPGLEVTAPRGALLGDFSAERVSVRFGPDGNTVLLHAPGWRGFRIARSTVPGAWLFVHIDELRADRIDVRLAPPATPKPKTAPVPPADLKLPVEVEIGALRVGEVHADALAGKPLRDLRASIHLHAEGGAAHRLDGLAATWDRLAASGSLRAEAGGEMQLDARLQVTQAALAASVTSTAPSVATAPSEPATRTAPGAPAASTAPPASTATATPDARTAASPAAGLASIDARAALSGPLLRPRLSATVRVTPLAPGAAASGPGPAPSRVPKPAQSFDAQATLQPFEPWPLRDLRANVRELDLSALASAAPLTSLSGTATATTDGLDRPASVLLDLVNVEAGRWNEARLPLRELKLELGATPNDPRTLDLRTFDIVLGPKARAAGRIQGTGRWTPAAWQLDARLTGLAPAELDARAPAMQLSGPLALRGSGFGGPDADSASVEVKSDLRSTRIEADLAPAAVGPAEFQLDVTAGPRHLELRTLRARAAGARVQASGTATRDKTPLAAPGGAAAAPPPWKVKGQAALLDFDPRPWWPGPDDPAWRTGPQRLNAKLDVDVTVPDAAGASAATPAAKSAPASAAAPVSIPPWLAGLRGRAGLVVDDSVLGGVPLAGRLDLRGAGQGTVQLTARLDAAGNGLEATGSIATAGSGAADRWQLGITGPALDRLVPLYRLALPAGADARLGGSLRIDARLAGRWPQLTTDGDLVAEALRVGATSVRHAEAHWALGTAIDAAIDLRASLDNLATASAAADAGPGPSIESLRLSLKGTARDHRLEADAVSNALPPAWMAAAQGRSVEPALAASGAASVPGASARGGSQIARVGPDLAARSEPPAPASAASSASATAAVTGQPPERTLAVLRAQGGAVLAAPEAGQDSAPALARLGGWRGSLQRAEVNSSAVGARPLLTARDVALDVQWAGGPTRVNVQPNGIRLIGAALRWSRLAWQAASTGGGTDPQPARLDVQATLEPLQIAPFLAAIQPDFGWGGDLVIAGRADIRSTPAFSADVVVERRGGDLTVTDETLTRSLGMTDLRLALKARDGVWNVTQSLAGKTLGVVAGAVNLRTAAGSTFPDADSPLGGTLDVHVADLGDLGPWVPPGWRLGGALDAKAAIGGRFGAPEYTGQVNGTHVGIRNFLQGVNVSEGDVAISLRGTTAHIERFNARAGDGSIRLEGGAELGATPTADVRVVADRFQVLGRVDRRIVASGQAALRLDKESIGLTGRFDVDQGLIDFTQADAPSRSDDVEIVRGAQRVPTAAQAAAADKAAAERMPAAKRKVSVDLQVGLGEKLQLRGRGLATGLRGDLKITAPGGRMAVNGTVRTEGGNYNAYGQKLVVDRGLIAFTGAVENPRLDIEATRPNIDVRVGVAISGTAQNPRIRLFSEPELSEVDKLSWLVMGRASDGLGRTETALMQRAALALLSGEGESSTDKFTKAIGLDEFSVSGGDGGDVRGSVVSLGKQISKRWYVGYEQSLNAAGGSFQLLYRIAQRFTLRAQSGADNSLDGIWTWRWK